MLEDAKSLMEQKGWNEDLLRSLLLEEVSNHIINTIVVEEEIEGWDKPWSILNGSCKFSISSSWEVLRTLDVVQDIFEHIYIKGIPFKVSFFLWRL